MAQKAQIVPQDLKGAVPISVMFNPNEYTVSYEAKYTGENDKKQFVRTTTPEFKVSLFYDTYEKRKNVKLETYKVTSLLDPEVAGKEIKKPPSCVFIWGEFSYRGVLTRIDQKYTMFLEDGTPVRSVLDVTFISDEPEPKVKKAEGSEACRKLWIVKSGDRLDFIAREALKDPKKWRIIAEANKIVNPFGFPDKNDFGRTLVIPD